MSLWGTKRAFAQHLSMYAVFGIDSGPQGKWAGAGDFDGSPFQLSPGAAPGRTASEPSDHLNRPRSRPTAEAVFPSTRSISIRQVRPPKISSLIQSASAFRPFLDISRYQQRRSASQR